MHISTKMTYIRTDGWRGYQQPINAVGGANDTGTYSDSPCPSGVRRLEIKNFTTKLRKNSIPYRTIWCTSSNIFCVSQFVIVSPEHRERGLELAKEHESDTRLFYSC